MASRPTEENRAEETCAEEFHAENFRTEAVRVALINKPPHSQVAADLGAGSPNSARQR